MLAWQPDYCNKRRKHRISGIRALLLLQHCLDLMTPVLSILSYYRDTNASVIGVGKA